QTPRLVPALVDGLLSRNLRAELVTSVVGAGDSQALVAALTRWAADSSRPAEARGEAVRVLAKVPGARAALLSIASGEVPTDLKRQNGEQAAGRDGPPRYRLDDDTAGVRGTALQLLSLARPQPPPELADAAAAALSSNSPELRAAAVSA